MAEPIPEIDLKEEPKTQEQPKPNLNIFDSNIYDQFIKLLDDEIIKYNKDIEETFLYLTKYNREDLKQLYIDIKPTADAQYISYVNLDIKEKRQLKQIEYSKEETQKIKEYGDFIYDVFNNEDLIYNENIDDLIKEALIKFRILYNELGNNIPIKDNIYKSLDGFLENTKIQKIIDKNYELDILNKRISKLKNEDLPKLKTALISEIEKKEIDQKKIWFGALVEYVKSGDFRKEVFMPLIILVVGLVGTDSLKPLLSKIGITSDSGDIKQLTKYIKNQTQNTKKLINELEDLKYKDNVPKNNNKHIKKLLGHRVGL